ncbi:MAG: ATP-dependent zinc metalloprotease FtsH [Planctomycetota bacterium]
MTERKEAPRGRGDERDERGQQRKPRGVGGVLLIMALLLALFVMVSRAGMQRDASIYDFYRYLLNARIEQTSWEDGRVVAQIRNDQDLSEKIEVAFDRTLEKDGPLIQRLLPFAGRLDKTRYRGHLDRLQQDVKNGSVMVKQAIFVAETAGAATDANADPAVSSSYVVAIVDDGEGERLVRADARAGDPTTSLVTLRRALIDRSVPIEDRSISRDPSTLRVERPNTALYYLLGTIGPWVLILVIAWFLFFRQMRAPGGSGGVLSFGRSRAALYTKENRTNVTFDDVAGIDEAKEELREIIEFLKNPQRFAKLGGNIPRGVLLVGAPGTGKTLLAKAIAGEAEVPFFSISGSDFVEMFVGVGASRVRDLFRQARENSPCIVFLDEIDAVGRKRGTGMGGGHDEREQTLNAILVEMDGFDSDRGTILVAATNRPDVLDPALLRPGRFDRQVVIDMPDVKGREKILRVHARKIKLRAGVDLTALARATPGFSGAELAALVNEAAILAAMRNKEAVDLSELEEARDRVRFGREKRSRMRDQDDLRVTAFHEAGHAVVSTLIPGLDPIHKVTIVSRGLALGLTTSLPERDDYHHRRNKLLGMIAMCYGGRIAEELEFGEMSAGAQNDIEQATNIAKLMVCELGMSDVAGPINYTAPRGTDFLGRDFAISYDVSQETLAALNKEVRRICEDQYSRAKDLLLTHRAQLDLVATGLLKYETLTGDEVAAILRGDDLDSFRAARARSELPTPRPSGGERPEPDVGLAGTEGLAHS